MSRPDAYVTGVLPRKGFTTGARHVDVTSSSSSPYSSSPTPTVPQDYVNIRGASKTDPRGSSTDVSRTSTPPIVPEPYVNLRRSVPDGVAGTSTSAIQPEEYVSIRKMHHASAVAKTRDNHDHDHNVDVVVDVDADEDNAPPKIEPRGSVPEATRVARSARRQKDDYINVKVKTADDIVRKSLHVMDIKPWWDMRGVDKMVALANLNGQPSGKFIIRDSELAFATLSMIGKEPELKLLNYRIEQETDGLRLARAPTVQKDVDALVEYYMSATLPCGVVLSGDVLAP